MLTHNFNTLHYRLRCPIGFLNVQKKSKSKRLFLTQGIPKSDNFALFVKIMTQILYQKYFVTFSESKYGQNHGQCSEKVDFGYGDNLDQRVKIPSFTEALFMVKLDF